MKIFRPNKYVPTLLELSLPFALYCAIGVEWYWWVAGIIMFLLYRIIGHNVGLHRFYSHSQFETTKLGECILAWFSLTCTVGSPLSYTMIHLVHHKYSDTDMDPHGPAYGKKSLLYSTWKPPYDLDNTPVFGRRLFQLNKYTWLNDWYWVLIFSQAFIAYLINWKLFVLCWWLPVSIILWEVAISTYISHKDGNQIRPTDKSSFYGKLLPFHEYMHEVHHDYPMLGDTAIKPGQIDYTHMACNLFATKWRQEKLETDPK